MNNRKILTITAAILFWFINIAAQNSSNADEVKQTAGANTAVLIIAGSILVLWLVIVIAYLIWAVHRYSINYGLSNKEWKVLYPELYASRDEKQSFINLKNKLVAKKQDAMSLQLNNAETAEQATAPFEEPAENPYKWDSFGLPPNTIRGIIALTALVLFVLMEGVNFFSNGNTNLEEHFKELTLAFEMIIAFYFGSRAVEVLKLRNEKAEKKEEEKEKDNKEKQPAQETKPEESTKPATEEETKEEPQPVQQAEAPIIPEEKTSPRLVSAIENAQMFVAPADVLDKFKDDKAIQNRSLNERILALTGAFETSETFPKCFAGLTNNFDGQGISFGVLQWNFGQGSLPPLLQKMNSNHPDTCKEVFGDLYFDFESMLKKSKAEQLAWSKSIQYTQNKNGKIYWSIDPKWLKAFKALGLTDGMISIQVDAASLVYQKALKLAGAYELTTERGAMLMFDIVTQNGIVDKNGAGKKIREDYLKIPADMNDDEKQVEKMTIIANRRAEVSKPAYVEDVRKRKLIIATGEGKVHSRYFNLEKEFNITLKALPVA